MSGDFFNKDEQEIIGIAVEQLSSVCDNAQMRDYIGFNRADASVGHHLASLPVEEWTETEYMYCWTILFKYRSQLEKVFGTSIDNLYQNRLSVLKEKSKDQKLKDLTSLKKIKKKDDSHIRNVLKTIGDTLKGYVNGKDIIHYNNDSQKFEITQNTKKHSESFLAAMSWIGAIRDDGDTFTKWAIDKRYREAVAYIVVKLIGRDKCHITSGTLDAIKEDVKEEFEIRNLVRNGFDLRDYITISEDEGNIKLLIYPRGSYGSFKQMSRFDHQPDQFRATASLVYMKDLRLIKTACSKKDYKIYHNGVEIGFFGVKNLMLRKKIKNPLELTHLNDKSIEISGDISLINKDKLDKIDGLSVLSKDNSVVLVFESLEAIDKISRMIKPMELKITYSKFNSSLLMSNSDKIKKLNEEREKEQEIVDMGNSVVVDIDQDIATVRFEYNEKIINMIKSNVKKEERDYIPSSQVWKIKNCLGNKKIISYLLSEGFAYRER